MLGADRISENLQNLHVPPHYITALDAATTTAIQRGRAVISRQASEKDMVVPASTAIHAIPDLPPACNKDVQLSLQMDSIRLQMEAVLASLGRAGNQPRTLGVVS